MNTKEQYINKIISLWSKPEPDYGGNVIPVMKLYKEIDDAEERKIFQEALESLLTSSDTEIRKMAVTQCLGFFVFRDAI